MGYGHHLLFNEYHPHPLLIFLAARMAGGILAPSPEMEPALSAVKAQSPNHWTTREFHSPP